MGWFEFWWLLLSAFVAVMLVREFRYGGAHRRPLSFREGVAIALFGTNVVMLVVLGVAQLASWVG